MKTVQKYWVLSLFMVAGLVFAGCGDTASDGGGTGGSGDTNATSNDGSGDKEGEGSGEKTPDNASTNGGGEFQLVSLNVPHMT